MDLLLSHVNCITRQSYVQSRVIAAEATEQIDARRRKSEATRVDFSEAASGCVAHHNNRPVDRLYITNTIIELKDAPGLAK